MNQQPAPEFTIVGDDRLTDSTIEMIARLLLEAADEDEDTE